MTIEHAHLAPRRGYIFAAIAVLLVAVVALTYSPGTSGGFIFDDHAAIVDNSTLHIRDLERDSLARAALSFEPGSGLQARPLSMASFGVNHALHELHPAGYKIAGIVVHALNAVLILLLAHGLIQVAWRGHDPRWAATAVATAWALHPLQVSTVLYVVQRMETLSLLFALAALLCYLRGRLYQRGGQRAWPWLVATIPLTALGIAAKETAVLLPVYALAIEMTLLRFGAASARVTCAWKWSYGLASALASMAYLALVVPHYWVPEDPLVRGFGTADRLLTQLRILPMHLGQMLWPMPATMPFNYDHILPSRGWLQPATTLAGGMLLASLIFSAVALRRTMPLYALGIALFFSAHALTSNVFPLELVFEHRNYFALFGVLLALADLVRRMPPRSHVAYKRIVVATMIAMCIFLTYIRASIWGDPLLLATEHVTINPASARASVDLAAEYQAMTDGYPGSPFNDFAMREFERGSLIPGASIISDQGLILTAVAAGRQVDPVWWDRLIHKVEHERITPETTHALFGLLHNRLKGVALDDKRLSDAFVAMFNRVTLPPYSYAQFGDYVVTQTGDQTLADQIFVRAVDVSVDTPDYVTQMIIQLRKNGHQRQADAALRRALELDLLIDFEREPARSTTGGEAPDRPAP